MTSNSDKNIISVVFLSLLLIFELIQQAALNFMLFWKSWKPHFEYFEGKIAYPLTWGHFFLKTV